MQPIDDGEDLPVALARAAGPPSRRGTGAEDLAVTLSLDDLLPDANGEIVIVDADGGAHLSIVTDQRVCDTGVMVDHVTAGGYDVAGLAYCAFESGTKLYYSPDLMLTVAQADPC